MYITRTHERHLSHSQRQHLPGADAASGGGGTGGAEALNRLTVRFVRNAFSSGFDRSTLTEPMQSLNLARSQSQICRCRCGYRVGYVIGNIIRQLKEPAPVLHLVAIERVTKQRAMHGVTVGCDHTRDGQWHCCKARQRDTLIEVEL